MTNETQQMKSNNILQNPIVILGVIVLVAQVGVSWLSRFFVFGVGYAERPIGAFLVLEFLSFCAYFAAIEWVRKWSPEARSSRSVMGWIFLVAIVSRLSFLPSHLIQETDPYRYIWDGQAVLQGANPYERSPQEAFLEHHTPAQISSAEVLETVRRINHSGIKTIYPPLAQILFAFSQLLTPWKLTAWRFMILTSEIGTVLLILIFLKKLQLKSEWVLLYGWAPLVIKEFSNSLHVDAFAVFFLCLMVIAIVHERFYLAFMSLALAVGVKLFALALLPIIFFWTWKKARRHAVVGLALTGSILAGLYVPFIAAGNSLFKGLGVFAGTWRVNEGIFGFIRAGLMYGSAMNSTSVEIVGRLIVLFLFFALFLKTLAWLKDKNDSPSLFTACLVVTSGLFFLAPTGNPWYFTWIFPFLFFLPLRSLSLFSGLVFLYYSDFYFTYHVKPELFNWVKVVEYGLFYLALGWELWKKGKKRYLSFYPLQTSGTLSATR